MFTGITEQVGKIESLEHSQDGGRLRISFGSSTTGAASEIARETKLGDSISVNGCCLTVVEFTADDFAADLSGETLRRTNFGEKKSGNLVNLERPLAAGARLGGHFMQGHVDGIGRSHPPNPRRRQLVALRPRPRRPPPLRSRKRFHRHRRYQPHSGPLARWRRRYRHHPVHASAHECPSHVTERRRKC